MSKFVQVLRPSVTSAVIAIAVIAAGVSTASNAYALEAESEQSSSDTTINRGNTTTTEESQNRLRTQQREALEAKKQEAKAAKEAAEAKIKANQAARQERLSASKLEICKKRETNINNRISRIADRSTKHLELFNKISERAQAFYISKGNTLVNYDELVADVAAKKAAAETAVTTISSTTASFDCEGENPKVTIEEFKISLKTAIEVLKEYRTSVKNLIVGIKSVNAVQANDSNKPAEGTE